MGLTETNLKCLHPPLAKQRSHESKDAPEFCPQCESQPEDHPCLHEHPLLNNSAAAIWN